MAVTAQSTSTPGTLLFSTLKQYAKDALGDRTDTKAIRREERIVNQGAKRLAGERNWAWYLRRHRIVYKPPTRVTAVSMSALKNTVRKLSGQWPTSVALNSFYFSGDTELMRVRRRDSSTQITTFSTDVWVASANKSNAAGFLVRDRYPLPSNFKCLADDIHQKDFFGPDGEISRAEMLHLDQTFSPAAGSPVNYTLEFNEYTRLWEVHVWQFPSELRSADLWIYVWPVELATDSEVLDWDPNLSQVLYRAMDMEIVAELREWDKLPAVNKAYQDALLVAKNAERKSLVQRVAGPRTARAKWVALNRTFPAS